MGHFEVARDDAALTFRPTRERLAAVVALYIVLLAVSIWMTISFARFTGALMSRDPPPVPLSGPAERSLAVAVMLTCGVLAGACALLLFGGGAVMVLAARGRFWEPYVFDRRAGLFLRGRREVCPLSRIALVRLRRARDVEDTSEVSLILAGDGAPVPPYTVRDFRTVTGAEEFARTVADFLGVAVVEGETPGP